MEEISVFIDESGVIQKGELDAPDFFVIGMVFTSNEKLYWRPAEIAPKGPARKANCGAKEKAITEFFQILYTGKCQQPSGKDVQ